MLVYIPEPRAHKKLLQLVIKPQQNVFFLTGFMCNAAHFVPVEIKCFPVFCEGEDKRLKPKKRLQFPNYCKKKMQKSTH